MSLPKDLLADNPSISEWAILHGYRGSIAHGTWEPSTEPNSIDDKDTMAFCVPPTSYYLGLDEFGSRGTREIKHGEWDIVVYEMRKAIRLLMQGNPNVLSMLWLPDNLYIHRSEAGHLLIQHRDFFVGKHVYNAFVGYAKQQFYKMEHGAFQGYMGDKRKKLVEEHGYDTKNAAHLIRLLRQAIEFLSTGEMFVQREDAVELLAIKHGEWSLGEVKARAERLFVLAEEALVRSTLPVKPDFRAVSILCTQLVRITIRERGWLSA